MSSASSLRPGPSPAQFNSREASAFLASGFKAESEMAQRGGEKVEVYKPAGSAWTGSWGVPKGGLMADGKDFLTALSSKYDVLLAADNAKKSK